MKHFDNIPQALKEHIDQLERVRQDFVANVSHELRTPLTVMHGYLEHLSVSTDEIISIPKSVIDHLYQHTLRMDNIVSDLLLLSKLEGEDPKEKDKKAVSFADLIHHVIEIGQAVSADKQHHITMQADETLLVQGSEEELKSLLSNLVINAIKYTPERGKIHITWFEKKGKAYLQVKDTGIGIDQKHIPRITERFYRVDKARSRDSGGTGLGLAIVKHVLMRHDATLDIESTIGKGSTFTCTFPRSRHIENPKRK